MANELEIVTTEEIASAMVDMPKTSIKKYLPIVGGAVVGAGLAVVIDRFVVTPLIKKYRAKKEKPISQEEFKATVKDSPATKMAE